MAVLFGLPLILQLIPNKFPNLFAQSVMHPPQCPAAFAALQCTPTTSFTPYHFFALRAPPPVVKRVEVYMQENTLPLFFALGAYRYTVGYNRRCKKEAVKPVGSPSVRCI